MKHLLSAKQFTKETLEELFERADMWSECGTWKNPTPRHAGRVMATLFYQPSTRTRLSFEAAMIKIGGAVISSESASQFSSHVKGETLEDTIRVVGGYADVIVLRHPERGSSVTAGRHCPVGLINAGDGDGEHPTQALLDMYTIKKEVTDFSGLHIALVGDLRYGRTVHSLLYLMSMYNNIKVSLVSPPDLTLPMDYMELVRKKFEHDSFHELEAALHRKPDVVYMTRAQNKDKPYDGNMIFRKSHLSLLSAKSVILHPLPRQNEIEPAVDNDERAAYFRQAQNGLFVRMAILDIMLTKV